jgi:demethylmenaquinone methyltransferase/2-methoxy-6-polyprenyl-1,4-benzoquinol methylase
MPSAEQATIAQMFDRIAATYDAVNRILSFGQDRQWRNIVADMVPTSPKISILDIATGTGDLLLAICQRRPNIKKAFGIDLSENMLAVADKKLVRLGLSEQIILKKADARFLPFATASFDVVSIAFGIRNVTNIHLGLNEMNRVLKPNGLALILEFSLPSHPLVKAIYLGYFRHILPLIGGIISKDKEAYHYLHRSVEAFPKSEAFKELVMSHGFDKLIIKPLSFGIASLYCARKS